MGQWNIQFIKLVEINECQVRIILSWCHFSLRIENHCTIYICDTFIYLVIGNIKSLVSSIYVWLDVMPTLTAKFYHHKGHIVIVTDGYIYENFGILFVLDVDHCYCVYSIKNKQIISFTFSPGFKETLLRQFLNNCM